MADPKEELIEYSYGRTVCQKRAEMCEPRKIRHVAWDADDTMWHIEPMTIASHISGSLKLIDPDTVEATEGLGRAITYTVEKPPKPHTPVMKVYNEKTKEWEWEHKKKKHPRRLRHPSQAPLGFHPKKEEIEDWWTTRMEPTKEEAEQLQEITEELYESMPEDARKTFEIAGEIEAPSEPPPPPQEQEVELSDLRLSPVLSFAVNKELQTHGGRILHAERQQGDLKVLYSDGTSILFSPTGRIRKTEQSSPPPEKAEELIYLEEIQGWKKRQSEAVGRLLKRYGKKVCKVVEVHSDGDITVECRGDMWVVTTEGQTFLEEDKFGVKRGWGLQKPPPPEKPRKVYEPKPIYIKLQPTFRETLDKLEKKGITSSVISLNSPGSVKRILETFGLADRFIEIKDTWENKGKVFDDITRKHHINPCNAMFVDNSLTHIEEVVKKCGLALQIGKGKDVEKPIEILNYIENHHGSKKAD